MSFKRRNAMFMLKCETLDVKESSVALATSIVYFSPEQYSQFECEDYIKELSPHVSPIEYVDPYEQNETYIANFIEHIKPRFFSFFLFRFFCLFIN
jgi:protoheme ferro-lyase